MALWLELMPKLHKSDQLDARYHQLDDWHNLTSFEPEGTRHTARSELFTSTSGRPALTQSSAASFTRSSSATTTSTTTTTTTTAVVVGVNWPTSSASPYVRQQQHFDDKSLSSDVNSVSLSVTVAVGSFLLFVNILVFVAVYYQKDRIRREHRRHKADLRAAASQQLHYRHDDVDGMVPRTNSVSSDARSNLSLPYGYTSTDVVNYPLTATSARSARSNHHHRHQQHVAGVTLPRLSSPPSVVDAPAYGTVRSRTVPRWSATSDQVELATTGLECVGHNGGLARKCPAVSTAVSAGPTVQLGRASSTDVDSLLTAGAGLTLEDSCKPSTIV